MHPFKLDKHGLANLRLCLAAGNEVRYRPHSMSEGGARIVDVKKSSKGVQVAFPPDTRRSHFARHEWETLESGDLLFQPAQYGQKWIMP